MASAHMGARGVLPARARRRLISLGNHGAWSRDSRTLAVAIALRDELPAGVRVVWKVSKVERQALVSFEPSSDMLFTDWMPQQDLLGHEKCRVFITHGGLNSVNEAAYHGVPVVGTPLLADQFDNMARPIARGFGQALDQRIFTASSLLSVVRAALDDPKYAAAAADLKHRLRAHRLPPVQRAADWIEYGIKTDGAPWLNPIQYTDPDVLWSPLPAMTAITALSAAAALLICLGWKGCAAVRRATKRRQKQC